MTTNIALIRQEQTGGDGGAQAIIDIMLQILGEDSDINLSLLCRKWEANHFNTKKIILNPKYRGRKNKQITFNDCIKNYLSQHKFELIQSHERIDGCHIFRAGDGVHKVWLEQKKCISTPLQKWWLSHSSYHQALLKEEKAMYEGSSLRKVICNSKMVAQEILENFQIKEEKIAVIYNGVDLDTYHPPTDQEKEALRKNLNISKEALVFIFPGSGFERKNLSTTINAFSRITDEKHLVVVGRDKKIKNYKHLCKKLGCEDSVSFLGAKPRAEMANLYQIADVLVLPTLYDPFPNVILEGLACGLPCISSTKCGAIDIIPQNNCGFIINATDTNDLYEKMMRYQQTKKLVQDSKNARNTAKQFSKERMKTDLLSLYKELLETN